ncbi:hypothetical protein LAZ67_19002609 [Cordylochernes scorpioides]|uniref:Uncharacterized protein n=1 Tax=Cordylochernes scorpioides TaxID=51811 RepID=A0ABY6LMG5_9ARAC|nr:hypothetical protein LAZ67_19002609 [Cordylochernes scorpioides]
MRVASVLRQPYNLYRPGVVDSFILGLMNQEANKMDPEVTTEVTNHLFERPGSGFGMDLAAINLQRARENGVPSYNRFREFCGLPPFRSFHDMMGMGVMQNKTVFRYSHMYR